MFWGCYCSIAACGVLHVLVMFLFYYSLLCATCSGGVIVLLQLVMCYMFWGCYCSITVCDVLHFLVVL